MASPPSFDAEAPRVLKATKAYQLSLQIAAALSPSAAIVYLAVFQDPAASYHSHPFHEAAIALAILLSAFATYVTWVCYHSSGERFLGWLTLGLLGFTILYAPHGALTRLSDNNLVLFVVYGPLSRLAMVSCFLVALLRFGAPAVAEAERRRPRFWLAGTAVFVSAAIAAGAAAAAAPSMTRAFLHPLESTALAVSLTAIAVMAVRGIRSPLMSGYMISMAVFAQSSVSFLVGRPWNHQWWLGHAIFATGFFVLNYGILRAFHTTCSFASVYGEEEMMRRLAHSEHQTRLILDSAAEAIFAMDSDGVCTMMNRSAARLTGYEPGEMVGANVHDLLHCRRADGTTCPESDCPLTAAMKSGEPYRNIAEVFWKRDGTALQVDLAAAPIRGGRATTGMVVSFTALAERQSLERRLQETRRLASLGRLAAGMAHEFNNVLMGINMFTEIIAREIAGRPVGEDAVTRVIGAVNRGKRVTEQIFQFTQPDTAPPVPIEVGAWLDEVASAARATLRRTVTLIVRKSDALTMQGDPRRLREMMLHLIHNADDAIAESGTITLEACRSDTDTRFSFGVVRDAASFAHLIVRDDGAGISPQTMQHLFEPLFTTRESRLGLGLSFAHQVVTEHGGQIFVESEIGRGSALHLFIPLDLSAGSLAPPASSAPSAAGSARSLVLVEDDEVVAAGLSALLEMEGLHVTIVTRGAEAVDAIARVRPDAVVLDVGLPDIEGTEVYARIAERWPDLPVLFSTGHANPTQLASMLEKPNVGYLLKPYEADAILRWLDRVGAPVTRGS